MQALWEERRAARQDMQPLLQQLAQRLSSTLRLSGAATLSELREGLQGGQQQVSEQVSHCLGRM